MPLRLPIIPPLSIYSTEVQVRVPTDMYDSVYGNYMDLLCNTVNFSNRQKLETNKMSLSKHECMSKKITWLNLTEMNERIHPEKKIYCIIPFM